MNRDNRDHKTFIREIVRQLVHPVTGLPKNLSPKPIVLNDWIKCLGFLDSWVNLGISEDMAKVLCNLKIGEVVPATEPNMYIYNKLK